MKSLERAEHALFPTEEMEIVEEGGPELMVDDSGVMDDDDFNSGGGLFEQIVLDKAPESVDTMNILREMATDLEDLRGLAETMASIRNACSEGVGRDGNPLPYLDVRDAGATPPQSSQCPEQAGALDAEHEPFQPDEKVADLKDVMVELRVTSLLKMPFRAAQQACQPLRQYIDEQADVEVEREFEEHWHGNAPEELRHVLRELLQAEIPDAEVGDTSSQSVIDTGMPRRSRL